MKYFFILLLLSIHLLADIKTERFASFSLNNGDLQIENGHYLEAIDSFRSAYETSNSNEIKAKAILREANLFSLYLDDKFIAIDLYRKILKNYSNVSSMEYAIYSLGMLYKDIGKRKKAIATFERYNNYYKNGKFSNQIEFMLRRLLKTKILKPKKSPLVVTKSIKIPTVRVLLSNKKHFTLSSKSGIQLDNKIHKTIQVKYINGKISINNKRYFKLNLKSKAPIYVASKNKRYRGDMTITTYKNKLALINTIAMNDYLYGVVTSESFDKWDIEALKAQAIASRTYAYYQSKVRENWIYDIKDNTHDQVYNGINGETHKSIKAVDETLGQILLANDKITYSQYTASSGWYSASSKEIFDVNISYLRAHKDRFSKEMPNGKWKVKIPISDFEKRLNKMGFNFNGIYALEPIKIGESGRVLEINVKAQNGEKTLRTYSTVRRAAKLKDILFAVKRVGNSFVFNGGGFGHGVGYSQWGGQKMAKDGYKYDEILKFYYANAILKELW
ncbi:SpoIID/LytB domain-containing protein [Sulfurimonas sp.]